MALELYYDPGCPYCQRVLQFAQQNDIQYEPKEISLWADSPTKQELVRRGGKAQVPFLVDTDRDVQMYESSDIIEYLRTQVLDAS